MGNCLGHMEVGGQQHRMSGFQQIMTPEWRPSFSLSVTRKYTRDALVARSPKRTDVREGYGMEWNGGGGCSPSRSGVNRNHSDSNVMFAKGVPFMNKSH